MLYCCGGDDMMLKLPRVARDALISLAIFAIAVAVCAPLSKVFDDNNPFAASVFMLAVVLTARFTRGYVFGIIGAAVSVFCVNFMFTYPFWEFNMTIAGYPLTFSVMLLMSITISTLTTQIKRQEKLRYEVDSEKMRSNLLRSVAHDLRTPLTSIIGASSAALDARDLSEGERAALLTEINNDARWLMRVMENILSVTKLSGDAVKLKKEAEVVEEIVGSAIVKFKRAPGAIPVKVDKPEEILLVPMEATLIEQVLINLFENAVAHGKTASKIEVRIRRAPGRVVFEIEDDGAGFSDEALPRVFEGDMRGAVDGRRNMGIGLNVCQSIIRAHGGEISGYNRKSGGAGIRFYLPAE